MRRCLKAMLLNEKELLMALKMTWQRRGAREQARERARAFKS